MQLATREAFNETIETELALFGTSCKHHSQSLAFLDVGNDLKRFVHMSELKADEVLSGMSFVRMPRVAVWPVAEEQWARVLEVSGTS